MPFDGFASEVENSVQPLTFEASMKRRRANVSSVIGFNLSSVLSKTACAAGRSTVSFEVATVVARVPALLHHCNPNRQLLIRFSFFDTPSLPDHFHACRSAKAFCGLENWAVSPWWGNCGIVPSRHRTERGSAGSTSILTTGY